ncbi:hypothetical protein ACPCTO_34935 [Streptomyces olivoreticuli]
MIITLAEAMGDLLPTASPPSWRDAVHRAAQLLAPSWPTVPVERAPVGGLAALSLILYALHHTEGQEPAEVPAGALREVLDGGLDIDKEPYAVKELIADGLGAAGHRIHESDHVMCRTASRVLRRDEPPAGIPFGLGGGVLGPSVLRGAAAWLKKVLGTLDEGAIAALPPAPHPRGPVSVTVMGQVRVVTEYAETPVRCTECQRDEGGQLTVDGDQVTYTCTIGHVSISRQLGTEQVRRAIERAQAHRRVFGPLYVAHAHLPAETEPAKLCAWLRPVRPTGR